MLPLLMLIPSLLWAGAKFIGPEVMAHSDILGSGLAKILSGSPTGSKIAAFFESVMGPMDEAKKQEFTLELDSMLGQIDLDKIDAVSTRFLQWGWRPCFCWGIGSNIVFHYWLVSLIDVLNSIFHTHIDQISSMDHFALTIMCILLGAYMGLRTIEKQTISSAITDDEQGNTN